MYDTICRKPIMMYVCVYVCMVRRKSIGICMCGAYKVYWDMYVW